MPRVTLFTTPTCVYCHSVKRWLQYKNIPYQEVDLEDNPDRRQEAIDLSGAMTVPVTLVERDDSSRVVIGYNLTSLASAIA
jgi:glutaredoxin 3